MKIRAFLILVFCIALAAVANAATFTPYPGAKPAPAAWITAEMKEAQKELAAKGLTTEVYTTADSFDKVAAFYGKLYKSYQMPYAHPNPAVKQAYFILDGASDTMTSKSWMKVQHPWVGGFKIVGMTTPQLEDVHDVTVIEYTHAAP